MPRFYLAPDQWATPVLRDEEAQHCAQVQRCGVGDIIQLLDGQGHVATAEITRASKREVGLLITETTLQPKPLRELTLCCAITKGESFEWILEKAVELGVSHVIPLLTERVIVRLNEELRAKKQLKWQRLVQESCKQCGQAWMPQVMAPQSVEAALVQTQGAALRLCASLLPQAQELPLSALASQQSAALAIGPEGDFTAAEYASFHEQGWTLWSLGHLTLRSETAAIHGVSILSHLARQCL